MLNVKLPSSGSEVYKKVFDEFTILSVQNYGSSGTLFVQSLLDNHPQILSTPALYSRTFYEFWHTQDHATSYASKLVQQFMHHFRFWFELPHDKQEHGLHQMGENMNKGVGVSKFLFRKALFRLFENFEYPTSREFYISVHLAYALALGRDIAPMTVILFPIHSLDKKVAQFLYDDFPNCKVLHMVREPVVNFGSVVKHVLNSNQYGGVTEVALAQICCDHILQWYPFDHKAYGVNSYLPQLYSNSRAVKLESLHDALEDTLKGLCLWLGIEWSEHLKHSTFDGMKWWNRPGTVRVSGTSQQLRSHKYNEYINAFDRFRLIVLNQEKYQAWNYRISWFHKSLFIKLIMPFLLLVPFKAEWVTFSYRVNMVTQFLEELVPSIYVFFVRFHLRGTKKKFNLNEAEQAKIKILNWLSFWLKPIITVYIVFRDYLMTRYWAFRALKRSVFKEKDLVELLK